MSLLDVSLAHAPTGAHVSRDGGVLVSSERDEDVAGACQRAAPRPPHTNVRTPPRHARCSCCVTR
jgi:hypothetical protein